jgi:hypothetical protein
MTKPQQHKNIPSRKSGFGNSNNPNKNQVNKRFSRPVRKDK